MFVCQHRDQLEVSLFTQPDLGREIERRREHNAWPLLLRGGGWRLYL